MINLSHSKEISDLREKLNSPELSDDFLLRFLVARKMNVTAAHDMIIRNQKWRLENNIDDIPVPIINPGTLIPNNIRGYKSIPDTVYYPLLPGSTYKESWKSFFQHFSAGCYHSKDKSGLPVYIERLGVLDPFPFMESCSHETLMDYHLSNVEFLHKVVFKECSEDLGKPVSKHTIIFDLEGISFSRNFS